MNVPFLTTWRCGHPRCRTAAAGIADPTGLRAIGWHVKADERGRRIARCPLHRPDRIPCRDPFSHGVGSADGTCALCQGEVEARGWQAWITGGLGDAQDRDHEEEAPWKA